MWQLVLKTREKNLLLTAMSAATAEPLSVQFGQRQG